MFEIKGNPQLNKDSFTFSENGKYPYFTRTVFNNGIAGYVDYLNEENKIAGNCLAVGMIGMQFFYMENDFYAGQFTKRAIPKSFLLTQRIAHYFITLLNKNQLVYQNVLVRDFEQVFNNTKIQLPIKHGEIDFTIMEEFIAELEAQRIAELEAYLSATGLKNFELTLEEERVLESFNHGELVFADFAFSTVFNRIVQGRRLKKDDQVSGNIPFVMAGITNTGVVNYISNPVSSFPQNSITIDIFGNTFYRNYSFGAGDDTGVYWHDKRIYSKETMLFFTAAMSKSLYGKFSFGNKLRSSQSLNFNMSLPAKDHEPDVALMQTFISAVQKLVIKDVVHYADKKIAATNQVVQRH